jgi:hypothetical protein
MLKTMVDVDVDGGLDDMKGTPGAFYISVCEHYRNLNADSVKQCEVACMKGGDGIVSVADAIPNDGLDGMQKNKRLKVSLIVSRRNPYRQG